LISEIVAETIYKGEKNMVKSSKAVSSRNTKKESSWCTGKATEVKQNKGIKPDKVEIPKKDKKK
jgi:hypothetical protein